MAKNTILLLGILSLLATLLLGINLGKKIGLKQSLQITTTPQTIPTITIMTNPTVYIPPTMESTPSSISDKLNGSKTTYTDKKCGFSFSYPGSFIRQTTENEKSIIFTHPDDPNIAIATTCATSIPEPPLSTDKKEPMTLDEQPATLYHDMTSDGLPRTEVIVRHPINNLEIIIAGYGATFEQALSTFKFIK